MSKIFLTSDNHFFHTNVIRYCNRSFTANLSSFMKDAAKVGFVDDIKKSEAIKRDVLDMNNAMVQNWNNIVSKDDVVIHLGDFAFAARAVEYYTPLLNGKKILIMGNHDFPHPSHKKGKKSELQAKWIEKYKAWGWDDVKLTDKLKIPGVATFNLSHIPYSSAYTEKDEVNRKYKVNKWAAQEDGLPLLCGHVHQAWAVRRTSNGSIMINVGIDAPGVPWSEQYRPARLEEVLEVYNNELLRT